MSDVTWSPKMYCKTRTHCMFSFSSLYDIRTSTTTQDLRFAGVDAVALTSPGKNLDCRRPCHRRLILQVSLPYCPACPSTRGSSHPLHGQRERFGVFAFISRGFPDLVRKRSVIPNPSTLLAPCNLHPPTSRTTRPPRLERYANGA